MSVFISYCRADDRGTDPKADEVDQLSVQVADELRARGHQEVFRDEVSITAGDEWRRKIFCGLARACTGIALLTPRALDSEWVRFELSVMTFRREMGEAFKLIPVLVDGTTIDKITGTKWLSPLALQDLQALAGDRSPELARRIADAVGPPPAVMPRTLREELAAEINIDLCSQGIVLPVLQQAAQELGGPLSARELEPARQELSSRLAEAVIAGGLDAVKEAFHILADRLGPDARRLLLRIAPLWVHREHALRIAPSGANGVMLKRMAWTDRPWGKVLGLEGNRITSYTAAQYVERAYWPRPYRFRDPDPQRPQCAVIRITNTDGDPETICNELRKWVRYTTRQCGESDADRWINSTAEPVFVLFPKVPDSAALDELTSRYPKVVFLVDLGTGTLERSPPGIERLPPVDKSEDSNWLSYTEMEGACR